MICRKCKINPVYQIPKLCSLTCLECNHKASKESDRLVRENKQLQREQIKEQVRQKRIELQIKAKTDVNLTTCSKCGLKDYRKGIQNQGSDRYKYINNEGLLWLGLKCPACRKLHYKIRYKPKPVAVIINQCTNCGKDFHAKLKKQVTCSIKCRSKIKYKLKINCKCGNIKERSTDRKCKSCKIKPIKIPIVKIKTCKECDLKYTTNRRKFCSKECSIKASRKSIKYKETRKLYNKTKRGKELRKQFKLLRKRQVKRAKPKWMPWKPILDFYRKKPEGFHVDHIIPLKGKIVSGLHVPWNFQYLPKEVNEDKSNSLLFLDDQAYVNSSKSS